MKTQANENSAAAGAAPVKKSLFDLSHDFRKLEAILEENGGELTPELEAAWDENQQTLPRRVDGYGSLIRKFKYQGEIIAAEIKRLQGMKKTTENAEKRLKEHLKDVMEIFGFEKLAGDFTKVSLRHTVDLAADDEQLVKPYAGKIAQLRDSLPEWLQVEIKVSKTLLKKQIQETDILPAGVEKKENTGIMIK